MGCEVEGTDEVRAWFAALSRSEWKAVIRAVELLRTFGVRLPFPHSSAIRGSRHSHMRELRIQHGGRPYRILYAFDPRQVAVLLIGGNKSGDARWYARNIPIADRLYDEWIADLKREGKIQ